MRRTGAAFLALAALVLTGCLGGDEAGSKAGGEEGPVTLRLGTDDPRGRPGADLAEEFARRVEELSNGRLRVELEMNAGGDDSDWDQKVASRVESGDLDLGLVPARAWDTLGVTSLRALNAPFLITSDELVAEVISGDLPRELMSGLPEAGVVGLALLPEGLRHPFGFQAPLLGPEDYEGREIRTPTSATVTAMFEALHATTTDTEPDAGAQAGMESAYDQDPEGTGTGNVTFFPKVQTLVIDRDALDELDDERREALEKAAAETRRWAIGRQVPDAQAARTYCERGGAVVLAGDAELAALEEATAPVYAELERDRTTRELIGAIRALEEATAVAAPAPEPCGEPRRLAGSEGDDGPESRFNGVYRFEITDAQLRKVGITDPLDVDENHGVFTVTLEDGDYCWEQLAPNPLNNPDECGTYEAAGSRVVWNYPIGQPTVYRFEKRPGGDLELSTVEAPPDELPYARVWAANTWKRLGGGE